MSERTPGPWWTFGRYQMGRGIVGYGHKAEDGCPRIYICDTNDDVLRGENEPQEAFDDRSQSNAEFIVRACNAHDDLLAALKSARSQLESYEAAATGESFNDTQINAAIAKAEGRS